MPPALLLPIPAAANLACSAAPLTRISPGLVVEGVGALKVACALPPEQLAALKAAGEAAGEHGWMIPAERVTLTNPRQFARLGQCVMHSSLQALGQPEACLLPLA